MLTLRMQRPINEACDWRHRNTRLMQRSQSTRWKAPQLGTHDEAGRVSSRLPDVWILRAWRFELRSRDLLRD